eukprot:TRINITY_DN414_c0_g1_i1.p1 TRINITY_DN414_c0_g1~~TRINITY_DN414_c0_g1_i1.p1  ORF type:complete len:1792 (+),score=283.43 TRINITY_DN414_c0_g1_i1:461-5377(+)
MQLALDCLEKAIELGKVSGEKRNLGVSYLNGSAILSLIGNHARAKAYAENAVKCASDELAELKTQGDQKQVNEKEALLGFAYFNVGVQDQHLGNVKGAHENYTKAKKLTENNPEASEEIKAKIVNGLNLIEKNESLLKRQHRYGRSFNERQIKGENRSRPHSAKQELKQGINQKAGNTHTSAYRSLVSSIYGRMDNNSNARPPSAKTDFREHVRKNSGTLFAQKGSPGVQFPQVDVKMYAQAETGVSVPMSARHSKATSIGFGQKKPEMVKSLIPAIDRPAAGRFSTLKSESNKALLAKTQKIMTVSKLKKELASEPKSRIHNKVIKKDSARLTQTEEIDTDSADEVKDLLKMGALNWSEEESSTKHKRGLQPGIIRIYSDEESVEDIPSESSVSRRTEVNHSRWNEVLTKMHADIKIDPKSETSESESRKVKLGKVGKAVNKLQIRSIVGKGAWMDRKEGTTSGYESNRTDSDAREVLINLKAKKSLNKKHKEPIVGKKFEEKVSDAGEKSDKLSEKVSLTKKLSPEKSKKKAKVEDSEEDVNVSSEDEPTKKPTAKIKKEKAEKKPSEVENKKTAKVKKEKIKNLEAKVEYKHKREKKVKQKLSDSDSDDKEEEDDAKEDSDDESMEKPKDSGKKKKKKEKEDKNKKHKHDKKQKKKKKEPCSSEEELPLKAKDKKERETPKTSIENNKKQALSTPDKPKLTKNEEESTVAVLKQLPKVENKPSNSVKESIVAEQNDVIISDEGVNEFEIPDIVDPTEPIAEKQKDSTKKPDLEQKIIDDSKVSSATKIQSIFRGYFVRKNYIFQKEHQKKEQKKLIARTFYTIIKATQTKTVANVYVTKGGEIEFLFTDCKTKELVHRWKSKFNNDVSHDTIKLHWMEILKETKGNPTTDCKELVERIKHTDQINLSLHLVNEPVEETTESKIEIENLQNEAIVNNECELSHSEMLEELLYPPAQPETKPDESSSLKVVNNMEAVKNITSEQEKNKDNKSPVTAAVTEDKKALESQPSIAIAESRPPTTPCKDKEPSQSETSEKVKGSETEEIQKPVVTESDAPEKPPVEYNLESTAITKIQRWYRGVLMIDKLNFRRSETHNVILRRNAKLRVTEMSEKAESLKETCVRIQYLQSKSDGTIEVCSIDHASRKRYKATFTLHKEVPKECIQALDSNVTLIPSQQQMHIEMQEDGTGLLKISLVPLIKPWVIFAEEDKPVPEINQPEQPKEEVKKIDVPSSGLNSLSTSQIKEGDSRFLSVLDWKEKAVCLIQSYFKKFRAKSVSKVTRKRGTVVMNACNKLVMTKGRIIDGRLTIIKVFYCDTTAQLRILVHDQETRKGQTFILDNMSYSSMTQDEFMEKMGKITEKMEYNKTQGQFFIGLDETPKEEDRIIGIVSLPAENSESPLDLSKSPSVNSEQTSGAYEIYRGVKKIGTDYYSIQVYINPEGKGGIHVTKEGETTKQTIEIKTDLKEFLKLNPNEEGELKLGRMIYSGITLSDNDTIYFDDEQLKMSIVMNSFKERTKKLTKVQTRFRLCLAREKIKQIKRKIAKFRTLKTEFGLKIGKQYHFIKVIHAADKKGNLIIKSNKAKNELEASLEKLGLEEGMDICTFKAKVKTQISSFLAYDPVKMLLVFYRRRNKQHGSDK